MRTNEDGTQKWCNRVHGHRQRDLGRRPDVLKDPGSNGEDGSAEEAHEEAADQDGGHRAREGSAEAEEDEDDHRANGDDLASIELKEGRRRYG